MGQFTRGYLNLNKKGTFRSYNFCAGFEFECEACITALRSKLESSALKYPNHATSFSRLVENSSWIMTIPTIPNILKSIIP